jgi:hypothetical protein
LEGASATIPLFVWSDSEIFNKHNEQVLNTLTTEDIENSLFSLLGLEARGFIGNAQIGTTNTVVLFVEPQLQTDQIPHFGSAYATTTDGGSLSALKGIVETSKSSFVAPYVTSGIHFSLLDNILDRIASEIPVVLVRDEGSHLFQSLSRRDSVQVVSVSNFKEASISNDKASLIVVCLNRAHDAQVLASHGDIIISISRQISSITSGNFVGMYTGNAAPSELLWTFPDPNAALFAQPRFGLWEAPLYAANNTNHTAPRTYMTGTMLEVFMVVIALLTMVFVGICNICALQVPETFETPKPQQKIF